MKEKLGSVESDEKMDSELDKDELDHHCNAKLRRGQKYTVKDLRKAQEADALLMAVTKLMQDESEKLDGFPRSLRKRAKHFFKGRKNRLYESSQGILCCKREPSERKLYRNDLIIPQVHQSEVIRRNHNEHQGIDKVAKRTKERFEWPGQVHTTR